MRVSTGCGWEFEPDIPWGLEFQLDVRSADIVDQDADVEALVGWLREQVEAARRDELHPEPRPGRVRRALRTLFRMLD